MNSFVLLSNLVYILTKNESLQLTETANFIVNSEFKHRITTSVVWWKADVDLVTDFLSSYQGCVEAVHLNEKHNQSIALQQAILFVTSPDEFLHFILNLNRNISSPCKIVTVLINLDGYYRDNITEIAWKYDIADMIMLSLDENQSVEAYTYYPYSNNECGNTAPVKADFKEDFFPKKFKNLLGCETRLGSIQAPPYVDMECVNGSSSFIKGVVGDTFRLIAGHLNMSLKVLCSNDENRLDFDSLNSKTIHIFSPIMLINSYLVLQVIPVSRFSENVWCGPVRREIYVWAKVLIPMMNNTTILLGVTYFILVAVVKIINKIEPRKGKKSSHIAWKTLAVILGQEGDYDTNSWLINFLFTLWLWFSMVITIAYQGVLVKGLQTKHLEPPFDTIENAVKLVDGYGGLDIIKSIYINSSIWDKFRPNSVPEVYTYIADITRGRRYLLVTGRIILLGYRNLQILDKPAYRVPISSAMTARWGPGVEISTTHVRLVEGGFLQKIYRDVELGVERREAMANRDTSEQKIGHLTFVMLCTCFYGLGVMSLVCFAILLLEIFHFKLRTPSLKDEFQEGLD